MEAYVAMPHANLHPMPPRASFCQLDPAFSGVSESYDVICQGVGFFGFRRPIVQRGLGESSVLQQLGTVVLRLPLESERVDHDHQIQLESMRQVALVVQNGWNKGNVAGP